MACPQLQLTSEVFGLPIEPPVIGRAPIRGQWVGLGPLTDGVESPVDITGITARVTESSVAGVIDVAVMVGAGDRTARFPWTGGGSFRLEAARFPQADVLVVRHVTGPTGGSYRWTHAVFDLRQSALTSSAPNPIVIGPSDVPSGVSDVNVCPDGSGRLLLLWQGYPASATGRIAAVYRTDQHAATFGDALIGTDSPAATGVIACKVETSPAPGTIAIYDEANRQPAGVTLPNPPPTPLVSRPAPRPGQLRLSARTLDLAASQAAATFTITNQGQDVLEVTAITRSDMAVAVASDLPLPACLRPGGSLAVTVTRLTTNAATATVTVMTAPAAQAGSNTVTVTLEQLVPDPRATVSPSTLVWKRGQAAPGSVVVKNVGNVSLAIGFTALPPGSPFRVSAAPATLVPGAQLTATVMPPSACAGAGPVTASFNVGAVRSPATGAMPPMIPGFPVTVALTACVPLTILVPPGSLRITTIEADAPGDDVMPEGEFIEFVNATSGPLDLTGCKVQNRSYTQAGVPSTRPSTYFTFGPSAFGTDSMLPPGRTVRLLTRPRATGEPLRPFVVFAGFRRAVWNNAGDTGTIVDANDIVVAELTYVTSPPAPGVPLPPGTVFSQPRPRTRMPVRRVWVDARTDWTDVFPVRDGDLVTITATGSARFGLLGNVFGPDGDTTRVTPADQGWPLEGAAPFALIGSFDGGPPFIIGSSATLTINRDTQVMLTLGPNDGELWDNGGEFVCDVTLYRGD